LIPQDHNFLVITELFLPTKGGTAVWFDSVYRLLGGKTIHIVTADVPGALDHDSRHPNTIHRIKLRRHWWLRPESLAMYAKFLGCSLGLALRHQFEAVHAGRVLPEGLVGWMVTRLIRRPLIIYAHGEEITAWRQANKFRAMVFTYRHADCVIANSEFTRNELLKLGVKPERIARVSPGVDLDRFRPGLYTKDLLESIGFKDGQKLILSVGRLNLRKGFDRVIRAIPRLLDDKIDVHYTIAGIGQDLDYLISLSESLHVSDRVHLLGHVSEADLPRWYNAANLFAMPNREIKGDTEGFGMVFLEAAACGKASLAGRAGGTGGAVIDGETGLRVNGASLDEVTEALKRLLSNSVLAQSLGTNGYTRVRAQFSWNAVAERTSLISRNCQNLR